MFSYRFAIHRKNTVTLTRSSLKAYLNKENINTAIPNPTELMNSEFIYSLTQGCNFGTIIIVIINDKTHFIKDKKLNENPFMKH